jgi:hypothetical protein
MEKQWSLVANVPFVGLSAREGDFSGKGPKTAVVVWFPFSGDSHGTLIG